MHGLKVVDKEKKRQQKSRQKVKTAENFAKKGTKKPLLRKS